MPETPVRRSTCSVPRPRRNTIAVLEGIRVSWEWLCAPPHPVTIEGAAITGLPDRPLALDEVRSRLLDRGCPLVVRDAVWAHLIGRSRRDGPTWTVACAGMALPLLGSVCRQLCGGRGVDAEDVSSAIVTGFVAALASLDLSRAGVASSLRWAALRAGHAALREHRAAPHPIPHDRLVQAVLTRNALTAAAGHRSSEGGEGGGDAERGRALAALRCRESAPPPAAAGHPDLVLADAVADGVLTRAEADLIGETRLEPTTLAQAAARRGRTVGAVTMQRLRAEMRLVDHLHPARRAAHRPDSEAGGDAEQHSAVPRRDRPSRTRSVTRHRSRSAGPRAPGCSQRFSPSVNATRQQQDDHSHDPSHDHSSDREHGHGRDHGDGHGGGHDHGLGEQVTR